MAVTLKDAEKITGLTSRQIHFYITNCEIIVRVRRARGARGIRYEYGHSDLIELSVVKQLADYGMTVSIIKKIIKSFNRDPDYRDGYKKEFPYLYVFNEGEGEFVVEFKSEKLTNSEMVRFPSHVMIDYKRIIDNVLSN